MKEEGGERIRTYLIKSLSLPGAEIGNENEGWSLQTNLQESYCTGDNSLFFKKELTKANSRLLVSHIKFHSHSFSCFSPCTLKYSQGFISKHVLSRKTLHFNHNNSLSKIRTSHLKTIFTDRRACIFTVD